MSIGEDAFYYANALKSISIPASVSYIGAEAFIDCDDLTSIKVAEGSAMYKTVDDVLFDISGTQLIVYPQGNMRQTYAIPEGVVFIIDKAFYNVENLIEVTFPSTVTSIGEDAFYRTGLHTVNLPEGLLTIADGAFGWNDSLTQVTLPSTLATVGYGAFTYCDTLTNVTVNSPFTAFDDWDVFDDDNDSLMIYGAEGSSIQAYAAEKELPFSLLQAPAPAPAPASDEDGDVWFCSECGTKHDGGKFCTDCGTPRPVTVVKCSNCDYEPAEGETPKFCPECGTAF